MTGKNLQKYKIMLRIRKNQPQKWLEKNLKNGGKNQIIKNVKKKMKRKKSTTKKTSEKIKNYTEMVGIYLKK